MPLLMVCSPKGGVGVTTIAANLAAWLARSGHSVVTADFSPHESLALHLERVADSRPVDDFHTAPRPSNLESWSVADGRGGLVGRIDQLLEDESAGERLVIADVPAGDRETHDALVSRCLIRLCVLAADAGSAAMLPGLIQTVVPDDTAPLHYVLNLLDERRSVGRDFHRLLTGAAGENLVAVIRRDEAVNTALAMLMPVFDHAPASAAASDIAGLADRIGASLAVDQAVADEVD